MSLLLGLLLSAAIATVAAGLTLWTLERST